jgi:hypothetical protein
MTTATEKEYLKGDITAIRIFDTELHFFFKSPTGDSTDTGTLIMPCLNKAQATEIALRYGVMLGLPASHTICWEDEIVRQASHWEGL